MTCRSSSSRRTVFLVLLSILLLNTAPTVIHFPPSRVLGPEPIVNDDFPKLLYYTDMFRRAPSEKGLGVAYDPAFFAGYKTTIGYATSQLYLALGRVLPWVGTSVLLKATVFSTLLLLPLLLCLAAFLMGGGTAGTLLAGLMGICLVHFSNHYVMLWIGNVTSLASLVAVPLVCGILFRQVCAKSPSWWSVALATACSVAFLAHFLFPLFVAPMALALLAGFRRHVTPARLALAAVSFLVMFPANLPWLVPFVHSHLELRLGGLLGDMARMEAMANAVGPSADVPIRLWYSNTIHLALIVAAAGGIAGLVRYRRGLCLALVLSLGLYGIMAIFRRHYLWLWAPRFYVMMDLTLALIAACGLPLLARGALRRGVSAGRPRWRALFPCAVIASLIAVVLGVAGRSGFSYNSLKAAPPFSTTPTRQQEQVVEWLQANADSSARVLMEDIFFTPVFGYRVAPLAAYRTGLQFIGGPSANSQVSINRIEFHVGVLAWKPIVEYDRRSLEGFLRTYNIGWVLAFSDSAVATFDRYPDLFIGMGEAGGFRTYRVARPAGYFEKGSGRVSAAVNRIDLFDLEPEDGEVVLRYHYVQGLKTNPPVTMVPAAVPEDPQPFIRLVEPPERVTIYF